MEKRDISMADDMKRPGRMTGAVLALALAWLTLAQRADAATACGTIITNVASATMTSGPPDFIGYEVSYNVTAVLSILCPPVVTLKKYSNSAYGSFGVAPSGGTVTFLICVENQTTTSVWGLTISDRLPANAYWLADSAAFRYNMTGVPLPAGPWFAYSSNNTTWNTAALAAGQGAPYYLRWTLEKIGPQKSACVSYTAVIL